MSTVTGKLRRCLNAVGLDIRRLKNVPELTLIGIPSRPIRTVVDIGANRGQFTERFLPVFPSATFHCYEPLSGPCAELRALAMTHPRVRVQQLALGEASGSLKFFQHVDHSPSSSLLAVTSECQIRFPQTVRQHEIDISVSTLDEQFPSPERLLMPQVLLKLDVQGYEDRVLKGGKEFLKYADVVIAEVCVVPLYEHQATFALVANELDAAGLSYVGNLSQVYGDQGEVIYLDAVFVRHSQRNGG